MATGTRIPQIRRPAKRAIQMIRALRHLARDPERGPRLRVFVAAPVYDAIELCNERFKKQGVTLRAIIPERVTVECRPAQLTEALKQLLCNACDAAATRPKRRVKLSIQIDGVVVLFRVSDSGPGVPEALRNSLARPFFSTKEADHRAGRGLGLGLSLTNAVAQRHGGRIWLDTEAKETTFVLAIPIR